MTAIEPDLALTTVPSAFRAAVEKYPDNTALEGQGTSLSYRELDRLSNRIANGLLARGGEQPLAMVAPLEPLPIIVMLGALKAGRIFVPLDPRDPPERLAQIREQLGAQLVSADPLGELALELDSDPSLQLDPYHPSLVYFTSGSSGRPKGTVNSHRQLTFPPQLYPVTAEDRFAVILPLAFSASITPIFATLLSGATGCFFDPTTRGIGDLAEWVATSGITVLKTSPSVLRAIAAALEERGRVVRSLRLAIIGGEACIAEQIEGARRVFSQATIENLYASAEASYIATTTIEPGEQLAPGPMRFQRIVPWQQVTIVDDMGHQVAAGETGEIVAHGPGVSLRYWGELDEAERRFFVREDGIGAVRTGDLGRFLPDGSLEHLGRADLRINIHGQSVDALAVEHALVSLPDVREAVVSAVPGRDGATRLIAHVLPRDGASPTARDLRLALARSFPAFMIPTAFVRVDEIPRTSRGKIDRELLRAHALSAAPVEAEYEPVSTATERSLAEIVTGVLGVERVGARDDLLELGADSLTSVELLSAIDQRLGIALTPGDLLEAPTVRELARRVEQNRSSAGQTVFPLRLEGSGTPFFCVAAFDGALLPLWDLARRLGRPAYSFVPHGVERRALPDRTIELAAARYASAVRAIQPAGPYLVGGYSFGGLVAYEMARQLRAEGVDVALLALLDPASPARTGWPEGPLSRPSDGNVSALRRRVRRARGAIVNPLAAASAGIVRWSPQRQSRAYLCLGERMRGRYRPGTYEGSTLVLRSAGNGGWSAESGLLTGLTHLVDVPGSHLTMLREPHVNTVAAALREALAEADPLTASLERTAE